MRGMYTMNICIRCHLACVLLFCFLSPFALFVWFAASIRRGTKISTNYNNNSSFATAKYGNVAIITVLARFGAAIDHRDASGWTPAHVAAAFGHYHAVALLAQLGANLNSTDDSGDSVLTTAVALGYGDIVQLLISCNVDVNAQSPVSECVLVIACVCPAWTI